MPVKAGNGSVGGLVNSAGSLVGEQDNTLMESSVHWIKRASGAPRGGHTILWETWGAVTLKARELESE